MRRASERWPRMLIALLLMLLPSLGLCVEPAGAEAAWTGPLMGLVGVGALLAAATA